MDDIFISEFFELDEELEYLGTFDAIINKDSHFFINILRLKEATTPEFIGAYQKVNDYFEKIMILLENSEAKGDRFFRAALKRFKFHGVKGINLGFSSSGIDAGFGDKLSRKVISDAYDIVKKGSSQPEIFQLVGLFEEDVASDRLSDMIATIIQDNIVVYTRKINAVLNINKEEYPNIKFNRDGIALNPFRKDCEILYVPKEILHELPIARDWYDIDRVISENRAIRDEINEEIGGHWSKLASSQKKKIIKDQIFMDPERCDRVIDSYRKAREEEYSLNNDQEYFIANIFKRIKQSGVLDFFEHSATNEVDSYKAATDILYIFKDWVENNRGWAELQKLEKQKEKSVQRLIHLSGKYYSETQNVDLTFEPNEGPGPADIKVSRGNDKTVIEIKLSSNKDYMHGFEEQIEKYAIAEGTNKCIFVYVQLEEHRRRDKAIQQKYDEMKSNGQNPPLLIMINALEQTSASIS